MQQHISVMNKENYYLMRNPNRISDIMYELELLWRRYPDLRLGQLMLNGLSSTDLYYKEDREMVETIKEFYRKLEDTKK